MTIDTGSRGISATTPGDFSEQTFNMSKDRNTPALYEVFGRTGSALGRSHPVEAAPLFTPPRVQVESIAPESTKLPSGPISPRLIRLPVGYVYVGLAVVVLLIVGSYFVGVNRGRAQALKAPPTGEGGDTSAINDPTLVGHLTNGREGRTSPGGGGPDPSTLRDPSTPPQSGANATPAGQRQLDRDTRQRGLNYIIVERFDPAEAWAVKEFLRRNGIDVLVLRDNNPALLQVVTAEGFQGWISNTAAQALDKRLEALGRQWKSREGGTKDFSQKLPKKYE